MILNSYQVYAFFPIMGYPRDFKSLPLETKETSKSLLYDKKASWAEPFRNELINFEQEHPQLPPINREFPDIGMINTQRYTEGLSSASGPSHHLLVLSTHDRPSRIRWTTCSGPTLLKVGALVPLFLLWSTIDGSSGPGTWNRYHDKGTTQRILQS